MWLCDVLCECLEVSFETPVLAKEILITINHNTGEARAALTIITPSDMPPNWSTMARGPQVSLTHQSVLLRSTVAQQDKKAHSTRCAAQGPVFRQLRARLHVSILCLSTSKSSSWQLMGPRTTAWAGRQVFLCVRFHILRLRPQAFLFGLGRPGWC